METFINTFSGGGTNSFGNGSTGSDYEYNFSAVGGTGSSDLNSDSVLRMSPWGGLAEVGFTSLEQVFRNPRGDLGSDSSNPSNGGMGAGGGVPITGSNPSGGSASSDKSEPLLVSTNSTGDLTLDLNQSSSNSEPLVVGSNNSVKITVIGGSNSSSSGTEPIVVGTNNTIIGAENIPSNGNVPVIVATNSRVEFIVGDDTSSGGTTSLVLGTNKTIGSEERVTNSNAPNNDANYQWDLTSGTGGGSMAAGGDSLTGSGDSMTTGSNPDFFRNLFGAGQAPNPDYTYDFGTQNSGGNFKLGGVDLSMSMGGASSSSSGNTFAPDASFGGGMTNSNNSGTDLLIAGSNNTFL